MSISHPNSVSVIIGFALCEHYLCPPGNTSLWLLTELFFTFSVVQIIMTKDVIFSFLILHFIFVPLSDLKVQSYLPLSCDKTLPTGPRENGVRWSLPRQSMLLRDHSTLSMTQEKGRQKQHFLLHRRL